MALVKGRLTTVEIAENGSSIKLRMSSGDAVRLDLPDAAQAAGRLMAAITAAQLNATEKPDAAPTRYEAAPPVLVAADVNVNHFPGDDTFTVSASSAGGQRVVVVLSEAQLRFLLDTHQRTRTPRTDRGSH